MRSRLLLFAALLWTAFAPAALQAAETAAPTALTPTRVIYPGETVTADAVEDVVIRRAPMPKSAVATDPGQVVGKIARRTLVPGRLIPVNALREAWLVEQGKPVEAVFSSGVLSITVTAVALQPGAAGDFIRLRNSDSGKVFSGTVLADGTVAVGSGP